MPILAVFSKQSHEVQDWDIDFTPYLTDHGDSPVSYTVVAEPGITIDSHARTGNVVKVWTSGGTDGTTYKITVTMTTTGGRVREGDIKVKIKDY